MDELTKEEREEIARHIIAEAKEHCAECQEFVCDWCVYKAWRNEIFSKCGADMRGEWDD